MVHSHHYIEASHYCFPTLCTFIHLVLLYEMKKIIKKINKRTRKRVSTGIMQNLSTPIAYPNNHF